MHRCCPEFQDNHYVLNNSVLVFHIKYCIYSDARSETECSFKHQIPCFNNVGPNTRLHVSLFPKVHVSYCSLNSVLCPPTPLFHSSSNSVCHCCPNSVCHCSLTSCFTVIQNRSPSQGRRTYTKLWSIVLCFDVIVWK